MTSIRRVWRGAAVLVLGAAILVLAGRSAADPGRGPVYALTVTGVIDPVVAEYIRDGLRRAGDARAPAVLIRLDTPGGLLDATRDIVQAMVNAPFPVLVHVAPPGARAASAGVFITMAADVAAMAPQTHLGAAHPVSIGGGMPGQAAPKTSTAPADRSAMEEKAVSDAAAYARTLAAARGRNAAWAEKAVRESVSLTSEEAVKEKVIDLIAADQKELFALVQGREIAKNGQTYKLDLSTVAVLPFEMGLVRRWLHALAHPNLAYILLVLGFYALVYEFATPGIGLGATAGVVCLVLAFFSLQVLPLNFAGLILIAAGLLMMALDVIVASHGLLILGGLIAFSIGSFMLFDLDQTTYRVSLSLIVGTIGSAALYFGLALKKIFEARNMKPLSGAESLVGQTAEVRADGMVFAQGALWTAEGLEGAEPGQKVRIAEVLGTRLRVERF